MIGGGRPFLPEILGQTDRNGAKSLIFDLFSPIAPQPSHLPVVKKSSININRKFTMHFPMSQIWTLYIVPKPLKGGSKTQSVQNLNNKLRYH